MVCLGSNYPDRACAGKNAVGLPVTLHRFATAREVAEAVCFLASPHAAYMTGHTLVLDGIPKLSPANYDEARRFITLIDTLYDHRMKLVASAAAQPDQLYERGEGAKAFERTASRLEEMQSQDWIALPHLP